MGYGTGQKFGIAALTIGSILLTLGTCVPFWQHGEIDINTFTQFFSVSIPFFGSFKLATLDTGLWWYCREYLDDKKCDIHKIKNDDPGKVWAYRATSIISVAFSLLFAFVGLCQMCCSSGGKTIVHGVFAFIAGGAAVATLALYVANSEDENKLLKMVTEWDWAFYVYIVGAAIVFIDSLVLCLAGPDNYRGGVVYPANTGGTIIVSSSTQQQMQSNPGPQYVYPNAMYPGQAQPMYTGQQYPPPMSRQSNHSEHMSKSHDMA